MSREGHYQPSPQQENAQDPNELHYQAYMLPAYISELEPGISSDLDTSYLQDQLQQAPGHHASRTGDVQRYPSFSASDSSNSYHQPQQVYPPPQSRHYQPQAQQQMPRGQQPQQFRPAHEQYYHQPNQQMYNQQQYRPPPSNVPPPYQPPTAVISNAGQQLPPSGQYQPQQVFPPRSYTSGGQNQQFVAEQRRPMMSLPSQALSQQRNSPHQYFTSTPTSRIQQNIYPSTGQNPHYFPRQNESDFNDSNISEGVQALSLSEGVDRYGSPKSTCTPQFMRSQQNYGSQSPLGAKLVQPQYQYSSDQDYNDVPRVIEVNEQPTPSPRMFQDPSYKG